MPALKQAIHENHKAEVFSAENIVLFVLVFMVSMVVPLINGFPFLYYDSGGYIGIDKGWGDHSVTPNYLARSLYPIVGPWSLPIISAAVFSFLSVHVKRLYLSHVPNFAYVVAVVASLVPFYTGYVMADVWGLFMVLSLVILIRTWSPMTFLVLAFSITTHGAHQLLFALLFLFILMVFRDRRRAFSILGSAAIAAVIIHLLVTSVFFFGDEDEKVKWAFLGSAYLDVHRNDLAEKCDRDPDFVLCAEMNYILARPVDSAPLVWDMDFRKHVDQETFENASREFALFIWMHRPWDVVVQSLIHAFDLWVGPRCFIKLAPNDFVTARVLRDDPDLTAAFERSLQAGGVWTRKPLCRITTLYTYFVYAAAGIALAVYFWLRRGAPIPESDKLIALVVVALFVNTAIQGFFYAANERHFYKLFFLIFIFILKDLDLLLARLGPDRVKAAGHPR
jgi:hypothetical protein